VDPVPETPQYSAETSINTKREKEVTDGVSGENENDEHCARVGEREESILPLKVICNDFLVVKVNCWSYLFNIIKSI